MSKNKQIEVRGVVINLSSTDTSDYICITDMAKAKDGDARAADIIKNWIRTRTTLEFLGTWEQMLKWSNSTTLKWKPASQASC